MKNTIHRKTLAALVLALAWFLVITGGAYAGDDPSIQGELRNKIQASMDEFVKRNTIGGIYAHFDPVTGRMLSLKLDYLHAGIVRRGDFFVSCADMIDQKTGGVVDLDFFVRDNFGTLVTTQAIVHKADGKKRKYHLEKIMIKN